jgi:hypothetical protein
MAESQKLKNIAATIENFLDKGAHILSIKSNPTASFQEELKLTQLALTKIYQKTSIRYHQKPKYPSDNSHTINFAKNYPRLVSDLNKHESTISENFSHQADGNSSQENLD